MILPELIVTEARERGLRHFFGLPGGGVPLEMIEFGRQHGLEFVSVAHESSAAIMAAYNGLMAQTAGLALAIKGVGAANLVGGAANAHFERVPVVCCCESSPSSMQRRSLVGLCRHEQLFGAVVKSRATLTASNAAASLGDAFFQATDGRPGPVLLDFPADIGKTDCGKNLPPTASRATPPPDEEEIEAVRKQIQSSRRPVILAGADVIRAGATAELLALVENINAAVLVNMDAHGVIPESHPRWAGTFIGHFNPHTIESEILGQADFALLIGSDSLMSDKPWELDLQTCELAARPEYESLAARPAVRVNGDLKAALSRLVSAPGQEGFTEQQIQTSRKLVLRNFERPGQACLAAQDILAIMRDVMPSHGILFSETGAFILMLHHLWPMQQPGSHYCTAGGRTMGLMLPAILGAKLAQPDIPMLGIGGNGSTLMRLGELETFARTGVAVPLVIVNDQALGTMKFLQKSRGMPDYALDLHHINYAAIAQACGLRGVIARTPEQFEQELKVAMTAETTTLIDARVDPRAYQDSFGPTIGIGKEI